MGVYCPGKMPATIRRIHLTDVGDRLLRVDEAAAILGISERQVRRLAATGDLDRVKLGRATRVRLSDVRRLIERGAESQGGAA